MRTIRMWWAIALQAALFTAGCGWSSIADAAPARVASLNLCSDELVLLLASPGQIVSVTYLSHDAAESVLSARARRYRANDGSLLSVAALRPDLIVTIGGGGRDEARLSSALGARLLRLPFVSDLASLRAAILQVGAALGRPAAAASLDARIAQLVETRPRRMRDTLFLAGGGRTLPANGIGAEWLALAGLRERATAGRLSIEELLRSPPQVLVTSDYRNEQNSAERRWLNQPLLARALAGRRIVADGRRWTCFGPALLPEIERLRRELGN